MEGQLNMNHVMALKELIMGDEADDEEEQVQNAQKGSVLNPSTIAGGQKDKNEVAKPFSKVEIKQGERPQDQPSLQDQQEQQKAKKKQVVDKNAIWQEDEVTDLPIQKNDNRETPEFDIMLKQKVGAEDVFLGMSNMDPTSSKCQDLLMKIYLPGSKLKDIQLDVTKTALVLQSSRYYLHHIFPYPVKDKEGNAKWISDKEILQLTLPIVRDLDISKYL